MSKHDARMHLFKFTPSMSSFIILIWVTNFLVVESEWWSFSKVYYPPCPRHVDVRYARPDSCTSYIRCQNGHLSVKHCIARGLFLFDRVKLRCAIRWTVDCSANASNPFNILGPPILGALHIRKTQTINEESSKNVSQYLPYCPRDEDLYYAVPFSCRDYLHCYFGELFPRRCFIGLLFDRVMLRCRFFYYVDCNTQATNPLNPEGRPLLPGVVKSD